MKQMNNNRIDADNTHLGCDLADRFFNSVR